MSLPRFAALEARVAATGLAVLGNTRLLKGSTPFAAIIDRGLNPLGEFDLTAVRQDRMTVDLANAPALAIGDTVSMDPGYYSTGELAVQQKTSWKLERKSDDDGTLAVWWLR